MAKKMKGAELEQAMPKITSDKSTVAQDPSNDWETKNHMSTLMDAHEIMNNPDKMAKVHKLAGRHMKAVSSIADLKDLSNQKFGGKNATSQGNTLGSMTTMDPEES